ncbi:MAG: outer membrane beta-barrel domain-containing protein [Bdellovibrionales bacterium]|nr:outer membrane beta-barrel domain-containing protein [Bdellovibrionales bacterium]
MKKHLVLIAALAAVSSAGADDRPLENMLGDLNTPANQAPASVDSEKLYSVQTRYSSLKNRSEVGVGGGYNFAGSGYLSMSQVQATYRFHFNDRWSLGLFGSYNFNKLNESGKNLLEQNQLLPDVAYERYRASLLLGFNTFYGKIRFAMDSVTYFDQYIAIGPGLVAMNTGNSAAGVVDVGFVFWLGRSGSVRFGVQNEFFSEKRTQSTVFRNDAVAHLDLGLVFGGSNTTIE